VGRDRYVVVSIYDVSGRCVRTLLSGNLSNGVHTVGWDGKDDRGQAVGMGVYLCCMEGDDGTRLTRKLMLLK